MKLTEKSAREIIDGTKDHYWGSNSPTFNQAKGYLQGVEDQRKIIDKLVEALEKTLVSLVSYKKYTPEPYKQNPVYIMGSVEAEKLAIAALESARRVK